MQSEIRAALAELIASFPDAVVAVIDAYENTADAFGTRQNDGMEMMPAGMNGNTLATFRVSAATLVFASGDIITVDGTECQVTRADKDTHRALWIVEYTERV